MAANKMAQPVQTTYQSAEVAIPPAYLRDAPPDARPIQFRLVDFAQTPLPEYAGAYAAVLDHVLSPSECAELIQLAEASSVLPEKNPEGEEGDDKDGQKAKDKDGKRDPWRPALVNVGGGFEVLLADYRRSDRIIWDSQTIADRLWARLAAVPEVAGRLAGSFREDEFLGGGRGEQLGGGEAPPSPSWKFRRLNRRLRFLRYGPGHFFRPHCDGPYAEAGPRGELLRTHFTVHLYLNDSSQAVEGEEGEGGKEVPDLVGGATSFLSADERRRVDVDPKAGRVLIFQHRRLYHSGDEVKAGTKYTVRTDIVYEEIEEED